MINAVVRFDAEDSLSAKRKRIEQASHKCGSGFFCPKCSEHLSYTATQCFNCYAFCRYIPGTGPVLLRNRMEVSTSTNNISKLSSIPSTTDTTFEKNPKNEIKEDNHQKDHLSDKQIQYTPTLSKNGKENSKISHIMEQEANTPSPKHEEAVRDEKVEVKTKEKEKVEIKTKEWKEKCDNNNGEEKQNSNHHHSISQTTVKESINHTQSPQTTMENVLNIQQTSGQECDKSSKQRNGDKVIMKLEDMTPLKKKNTSTTMPENTRNALPILSVSNEVTTHVTMIYSPEIMNPDDKKDSILTPKSISKKRQQENSITGHRRRSSRKKVSLSLPDDKKNLAVTSDDVKTILENPEKKQDMSNKLLPLTLENNTNNCVKWCLSLQVLLDKMWSYRNIYYDGIPFQLIIDKIDAKLKALQKSVVIKKSREGSFMFQEKREKDEEEYHNEMTSFAKHIRESRNYADRERIEKLEYREECEEKLRVHQYMHRSRKRTHFELEYDSLLLRPIKISKTATMSQKRKIKGDECSVIKNDGICSLCNGDYARIIVTDDEIHKARNGNILNALPLSIKEINRDQKILNPSFRELNNIMDDISDDEDDNEKYHSSHNGRSNHKKLRSKNAQSEFLKIIEMKNKLCFVQRYNEGLLQTSKW